MEMYVDNDLKSVFSMCFLVRSRIRYRAVRKAFHLLIRSSKRTLGSDVHLTHAAVHLPRHTFHTGSHRPALHEPTLYALVLASQGRSSGSRSPRLA